MNQLKQPALLIDSPFGIALSTPENIQQSTDSNYQVTAEKNIEFSTIKKITMAAQKRIALFARELGLKLVAASGKIEIEAQKDEINLSALKNINISSDEEEIIISANKKITLKCNGSSITLDESKIDIVTAGDVNIKSSSVNMLSSSNVTVPIKGFGQCEGESTNAAINSDALISLS